MPVTEWDFVGRRGAGPVPPDIVAAIGAALQDYFGSGGEPPEAPRADAWTRAGRHEAVGERPCSSKAELPARL